MKIRIISSGGQSRVIDEDTGEELKYVTRVEICYCTFFRPKPGHNN